MGEKTPKKMCVVCVVRHCPEYLREMYSGLAVTATCNCACHKKEGAFGRQDGS